MPAKTLASLCRPRVPKGAALCLRRRSCCWAPRWPSARQRRPARLAAAAAPRLPRHGRRAGASAFTPAQRKELEAIIKDILVNNPEILLEVQNALEAKMDKIQAERMAVAIKEHAGELFRPAGSPVVGNAKGDVPVIEFFDYNCGYCKKAFPDVAKLMDKDKKVRVILKEFPILSKGSEEASRVALAAKMQGKYWEFHRAMLESQGQANEASALRVAEKLGLDMARLKKDMASRRGQEGDRRHAPARHQDGHPGHAALHRRRPHHPRCARRTWPSCWASTSTRCARTAARSARRPSGTAAGPLTVAADASVQPCGPPFRGGGKADTTGQLIEECSRRCPRAAPSCDRSPWPLSRRRPMPKPIFVLNGPNLNLLGVREPADLWRGDARRRAAPHRGACQGAGPQRRLPAVEPGRRARRPGSRRRARRRMRHHPQRRRLYPHLDRHPRCAQRGREAGDRAASVQRLPARELPASLLRIGRRRRA